MQQNKAAGTWWRKLNYDCCGLGKCLCYLLCRLCTDLYSFVYHLLPECVRRSRRCLHIWAGEVNQVSRPLLSNLCRVWARSELFAWAASLLSNIRRNFRSWRKEWGLVELEESVQGKAAVPASQTCWRTAAINITAFFLQSQRWENKSCLSESQ